MNNDEDEEKEEELKQKEDKKLIKSKEKILDESFKKATILKMGPPKKKEIRIVEKKPFKKLGIIIIVIALFGFIFINYIPWMYIEYETNLGVLKESFSYNDLRNNLIESEEIISLFESNCHNCSDTSNNYIGLTLDDFTNIPKLNLYIFIFLALLGIIFTIFIIFDRKKDFPEEIVTIIQSIFVAFIITVAVIIIFLNVKFLGSHVLYLLNKPYIQALGFERVTILFFMPYVLFLFSFGLLIIGLIFIRINLNKAINKFEVYKSKSSEFSYRFGSKY